jgi:hypothetical protein
MSKEWGDFHGDEDEIEIDLAREDLPDEDQMIELSEEYKLNRLNRNKNENYKKVSN